MSAAAVSSPMHSSSTREIAEAAKAASRVLAPLNEAARNGALEAMAKALEAASEELLVVNSNEEGDGLDPAMLARLKLDAAKLREMVEQVRSVAALPDPLGRVLDAIELDEALNRDL
jgi:glutamate-5-semialdehyde dehydrogenase